MKRILVPICLFLILTACHTRKVSIVKSDSVSVQKTQAYKDSTVLHIDTSKSVHKDSSVSVSNGTTTITEAGKFDNGKLDSGTRTVVKTHSSKKVKTDLSTKSEGVTNTANVSQKTLTTDSTAVKKSDKQTDSTSDNKWLWGVGIIVAGIVGFSLIKFKGK